MKSLKYQLISKLTNNQELELGSSFHVWKFIFQFVHFTEHVSIDCRSWCHYSDWQKEAKDFYDQVFFSWNTDVCVPSVKISSQKSCSVRKSMWAILSSEREEILFDEKSKENKTYVERTTRLIGYFQYTSECACLKISLLCNLDLTDEK